MKIIKGIVLDTVSIYYGDHGEKVGKLVKGDEIEASENNNQWLHLSEINNLDVSSRNWWTTAGGTSQYIQWNWVTVDDTDPGEPPTPEPTGNPPYFYLESDTGKRDKYIREDLI